MPSEGKAYWSQRWENNRTGWQLNDIHPKLLKYLEILTLGRTALKFFIPLCGKTKDIPFLLSLGHTVFGIEYVDQAIEDLDKENSLGLEFDKESSTYSTSDGRLIIYSGNFQMCPIENWGPFDVIWDRSSLTAIQYYLRCPYADLIRRSVMSRAKPGHRFRYLLQSIEYDKNVFEGPPRCITEEDVKILCGRWAKSSLLEKNSIPDDHLLRTLNTQLTGSVYESYHLLQNKY